MSMTCDGETLFHGSNVEFERPRPLTHFGTEAAALKAPGHRGVLMAFAVTITRALEVLDSPGGGDLYEWMASAAERGIVAPDEFVAWTKHPTGEDFVSLLSSKGYDGLAYVNLYEDPNSLSWVTFHPDQAVRVPLPAPARGR